MGRISSALSPLRNRTEISPDAIVEFFSDQVKGVFFDQGTGFLFRCSGFGVLGDDNQIVRLLSRLQFQTKRFSHTPLYSVTNNGVPHFSTHCDTKSTGLVPSGEDVENEVTRVYSEPFAQHPSKVTPGPQACFSGECMSQQARPPLLRRRGH